MASRADAGHACFGSLRETEGRRVSPMSSLMAKIRKWLRLGKKS